MQAGSINEFNSILYFLLVCSGEPRGIGLHSQVLTGGGNARGMVISPQGATGKSTWSAEPTGHALTKTISIIAQFSIIRSSIQTICNIDSNITNRNVSTISSVWKYQPVSFNFSITAI